MARKQYDNGNKKAHRPMEQNQILGFNSSWLQLSKSLSLKISKIYLGGERTASLTHDAEKTLCPAYRKKKLYLYPSPWILTTKIPVNPNRTKM